MDVKSCGIPIALTFKRCLTGTGFVTTAGRSVTSILDRALQDLVARHVVAREVSSEDNARLRLPMTSVGIKSGKMSGHASISISTFHMRRMILPHISDVTENTTKQIDKHTMRGCGACRLQNCMALGAVLEKPSLLFLAALEPNLFLEVEFELLLLLQQKTPMNSWHGTLLSRQHVAHRANQVPHARRKGNLAHPRQQQPRKRPLQPSSGEGSANLPAQHRNEVRPI